MSSRKAQAPPSRPVKLGLEMLEARENPANFYWNPISIAGAPVDYHSSNFVNWENGVHVRLTNATQAPTTADDLWFGVGPPSSGGYGDGETPPPPPTVPASYQSNCILGVMPGYGPTGGAHNGLHLLDYLGEIDMKESPVVGTLEMRGGKIKQDDPATVSSGNAGTLSVGTLLAWTKGTINSNTIPGQLNMNPGATGTIDPGDDNAVLLGSTMTLFGNVNCGSDLGLYSGKLQIDKGSGITVGSKCSFTLQMSMAGITSTMSAPIPKSDRVTVEYSKIGDVEVTGKGITVNATGLLAFKKKAGTDANLKGQAIIKDLFVDNNGGSVSIFENVAVNISGKTKWKEANVDKDATYYQHESTSSLNIHGSATKNFGGIVSETASVVVLDGEVDCFETTENTPATKFCNITVPNDYRVVISGSAKLDFVLGDVGYDTQFNVNGTLEFDGDANLVIRSSNLGENTYLTTIHASKKINFDGQPKLTFTGSGKLLGVIGRSYEAIRSDVEIVHSEGVPTFAPSSFHKDRCEMSWTGTKLLEIKKTAEYPN